MRNSMKAPLAVFIVSFIVFVVLSPNLVQKRILNVEIPPKSFEVTWGYFTKFAGPGYAKPVFAKFRASVSIEPPQPVISVGQGFSIAITSTLEMVTDNYGNPVEFQGKQNPDIEGTTAKSDPTSDVDQEISPTMQDRQQVDSAEPGIKIVGQFVSERNPFSQIQAASKAGFLAYELDLAGLTYEPTEPLSGRIGEVAVWVVQPPTTAGTYKAQIRPTIKPIEGEPKWASPDFVNDDELRIDIVVEDPHALWKNYGFPILLAFIAAGSLAGLVKLLIIGLDRKKGAHTGDKTGQQKNPDTSGKNAEGSASEAEPAKSIEPNTDGRENDIDQSH